MSGQTVDAAVRKYNEANEAVAVFMTQVVEAQGVSDKAFYVPTPRETALIRALDELIVGPFPSAYDLSLRPSDLDNAGRDVVVNAMRGICGAIEVDAQIA